MRYARISPDGQYIAFSYKGDIYTVPVKGGDAVRITSQPTYECHPVWSPDSKTIAFTSDRYGNSDIFTVNALKPGEWKLSLRTGANGRVNATQACRLLGGGGHAMAAGATVNGSLEEVKDQVLWAVGQVKRD